ncbi:EVE domain-containing protein [Salinicola salarius]|uniref:EVE domain-containing protein n=1 Tax=Salinicola salarius TaxID=430457 RepID=UPI000DA20617|nr:EVE domain-containing protein [Salinicola salarius]
MGEEVNAQVWLAISGAIIRARSPKVKSWWCLPASCNVGDKVYFYCPRAVSRRWHGIHSLYQVVETSVEKIENASYMCVGCSFESKKVPLKFYEIELVETYKMPLPAKALKENMKLRQLRCVKLNFQRTTFLIPEKQADVISCLLADSN